MILNKDNAEGLRRTLASLIRQDCGICKCFDIYVVDGSSKDHSIEVFKEIARSYRCVYWITQKIKGGTGPARIEIIELLKKRKYRFVIWGDSENRYDEHYVSEMIESAYSGCDVVSGKSIVENDESLYGDMFYWYHSMHNILKGLIGSRHAPGNNALFDISIYDSYMYPPISRSDDYFLTINIMRGGGLEGRKIRFCVNEKAIAYISVSNGFKNVIGWQRNRVKGIVEGAIYYRLKLLSLPDTVFWIVLPLLLLLLTVGGFIFDFRLLYIALAIFLAIVVFLGPASRSYVTKPKIYTPLLGAVGFILHGFFTIAYILKWYIAYKRRGFNKIRKELFNRFMKIAT